MNIAILDRGAPLAWRSTIAEFFSGLADKTEALLSRNAIWALAAMFAVAIQATLVLNHKAWLDEWQAVLIAHQSPDLAALFENLRYEGHPPLWYFVLIAVGAVVGPMAVLPVVQTGIAVTIQLIILTKLPLPRLYRLMAATSYFTLVELGSVSRGLSLGALMFLAFACSGSRALKWALAIAMPLVDFQIGLFSIIAITMLWRDGDRSRAGLILWGISGLVAAISIIPAPDMIPARAYFPLGFNFIAAINWLSALLLPFHFMPTLNDWQGAFPFIFGVPMGLAFIVAADRILQHDNFLRRCFQGFMWASLLFATFIYPLGLRHMALIAWTLIILVALQYRSRQILPTLIKLWLGLCSMMGLWGAVYTMIVPFSTSTMAADLIRKHGIEEKLLVTWPTPMGVPVSVALQQELISLEKECTQSFVRWDMLEVDRKIPKIGPALRHFADRHGHYYLISTYSMQWVKGYVPMRYLGHTPRGFDGYAYYLYSVGEGKRSKKSWIPACKPERLPMPGWRTRAATEMALGQQR